MADAIVVGGKGKQPEVAQSSRWQEGLSAAVIDAVEALGGPKSDGGVKLLAEFMAPRDLSIEAARAKRVVETPGDTEKKTGASVQHYY
jgi:hypothetical protein